MTRIRLLASVATFAIVVLWAGTAFAGTITQPVNGSSIALNVAGSGPAPFKIVVAGYSPAGSNVQTMICDGVDATAPGWDIGADCDINTAPPAQTVQQDGTATWDPSKSKNQQIGVFDGQGPNNLFNCFYPGELDNGVAYSNGQIDPNDGLPSWTDCQVRVASTNGSATADQAFATFVLPKPQTAGTTTTTAASGTTTSTPTSTTSTTMGTTTTTSGTTTTSTTVRGTTTTAVGGTSTTTMTTTLAGTTTTSTTATATATTTSSTDPQGSLPVTGLDADWLALIGIGLITVGVIAKSRRQA